jgi:hypothetical protein
VTQPAAEVYRVEVRRTSVIRRIGSWLMTIGVASSMEGTTPPWRDEAWIFDLGTGEVAAVVRNLVGGAVDDVGQVAVDVDELTRGAFERLWLPDRVPPEQPLTDGAAPS